MLSLLRLGFCAWRAAGQSITGDEAITFRRYVDGPWASLWSAYDANNYILHSIMAKLSVAALGPSELSLRLPSLIAGFFFVLGAFFVLRETASRVARWTVWLALALHPLLLDLSVAARGYSLGLALFTWALYFVLRRRYRPAGALLGLAAAATLTIAVPAAGLVCVVFFLEEGPAKSRARAAAEVAIPFAALFLALAYLPLRTATKETFYAGYGSFGRLVEMLVSSSVRARPDTGGLFGTRRVMEIVQFLFLPAVALYIGGAAAWDFRGAARRHVAALTLALTVAGLFAAHWILGLKYPPDRAALYLIVLFALAWAAAMSVPRDRLQLGANATLVSLLIVQFLTQMHAGYFQYWRFDMHTKRIARILRERTAGAPEGTVSIAATWLNREALEFYRSYYHIRALQPVKPLPQETLCGFDYYLLSQRDVGRVEASGLQVLFADPLAPVALAAEPSATRPRQQMPGRPSRDRPSGPRTRSRLR